MTKTVLNAADPAEVNLFKSLYANAIKNKQEVFIFKGQQILVTYAKYVLEYIGNLNKEVHDE